MRFSKFGITEGFCGDRICGAWNAFHNTACNRNGFLACFYANMEVASAARAGAQYGISSSAHWTDYTGMQNAATNDAPNVSGLTATASRFCTCPDNTATTCGSGGCAGKRTYVKVVTNATYSTLGSYLLIPSSVALSAQVSMRAK